MQSVSLTKKRLDGMKKKVLRDKIFAYCVLIWPVVHFIVFWLCMNVSTVVLSFRTGDLKVGAWNGWKNYEGAFRAIFGIDKNEGLEQRRAEEAHQDRGIR